MKESSFEQAVQAYAIECEAIMATKAVLDKEAFAKAVGLLAKAERIATVGCGHSGFACMHFAHLLCCIERPARFLSPAEAIHGGSGFLQCGDVLVWASRGGKTDELFPILEIAQKKGAHILGVTENTASPLAAQSDVALALSIPREADKYDTQGTASFAATNIVFDTLAVALLNETGFQTEQFALTHPGGAVGKRLNG
ncbi:MAG TPA: hypothetical protein DEB31_09580 [Clostridiales bacterium]|nr:hypothetical protein [Clostridiales bacterium]